MIAEKQETIADRLRERNPRFSIYQWEYNSNLYGAIKSYDDLKECILENDTNTRISAWRIVSEIADLLTEEQREDLVAIAQEHLLDTRMCEIGYGGSYADDEDTSTVSNRAQASLIQLERCMEKYLGLKCFWQEWSDEKRADGTSHIIRSSRKAETEAGTEGEIYIAFCEKEMNSWFRDNNTIFKPKFGTLREFYKTGNFVCDTCFKNYKETSNNLEGKLKNEA